MQKFILFLALAMSVSIVNAQENFSQKVKDIAKEIINVKKEEKEILKEEVDAINEKVANNEITAEEGDKRKEAAAERSAERIEERIEVLEEQLENLVENAVEETFDEDADENKVYDEETGDLKINIKPKKQKKNKGEPRTTSQAVFAIAVNTLIEDQDFSTIDNNKFQLSNARAYEFGLSYKTRVFSKSNFLHLKYGLSLRVNNVRPNENQLFVKNGDVTSLMTDTREYTKDVYFRTAQWVVPLYLEFDFTKSIKKDDEIKFRTQKSFRLGVGGYAGVNSRTRQVVHYTDDKIRYEEEATGNFNVNNFVYGLGAYVGYKDVSLYGKLDLNDLFSENSVAYNNLSVGLRWDFN